MKFAEIVGFKMPSRVKATLNNTGYYPFHMHDEVMELICVLDGEVNISCSALEHTLSRGDVYIFNARDPHKIESGTDDLILTIQIDLTYYQQFYPDVNLFNLYFVCDSFLQEGFSYNIRHLRFLMSQIYREYYSDDARSLDLEGLTKQLIDHLISDYQNYSYAKTGAGKYQFIRKENDERFYRIIDYIDDNYSRKITLAELAEVEFLSEAHLSRYIKQSCGLTFSELVSISRCDEVERLLSNTDKTLDQIAAEVGFSGRNSLNIQFKKWFSKTPDAHRKSINKDLFRANSIKYNSFDPDKADRIIESYLDG